MNLRVNNIQSSNFTPSFKAKIKNEKIIESYILKDDMDDLKKNISKLGQAFDTVEFSRIYERKYDIMEDGEFY